MLQLQNKTPFTANLSLLPNEQGQDTLFVIASASFKWNQGWGLADDQPMPTEADQYLGEPGQSSVIKPSEYHLGKLATDVIVVGDACAPEGQRVNAMDISIQLGQITKSLRVFGDRYWRDGHITAPEAFDRMPITYERAYGGQCLDVSGAVLSVDVINPVGVGHFSDARKDAREQSLVPNIEDPNALIQNPSDRPVPAGFGAIAPSWQSRSQYAGTYDDAWSETRAPYLPSDFDKRFFNCASPDLIYPGFIRGGEQMVVKGMHPGGAWATQIPIVNLLARVLIGQEYLPMSFNLETVLVEPNDLSINLTWRASIAAGKSLAKVSVVELAMARQPETA